MSSIDRTLKHLRPSLRLMAPQTFWFSFGFGVFNILIGIALVYVKIFVTLKIVGVIPLQVWGIIFLTHGVAMLSALSVNSWKSTRVINTLGVAIKTAWWLELVSITIVGHNPFLLYIWSLLLFFQIINCVYFMPRVSRD